MMGEAPDTAGITPQNDGPGNAAYQAMRDLEAQVRARVKAGG